MTSLGCSYVWSVAPRIWRQHACRLRRCVRYTRLVFTVDRELARFLKTLRDWHRRCFTKMRSHMWTWRLSRSTSSDTQQAEHFITRILNLRLQYGIAFSGLKLSGKCEKAFQSDRFAEVKEFHVAIRTFAVSIGISGTDFLRVQIDQFHEPDV